MLVLAVLVAGCGKSSQGRGAAVLEPSAPPAASGVASVVTKNTARLGGHDAVSDAAAVARAVYPGLTPATRPQAVVLVDEHNWPAALAASVFASSPLGAPLLFAEGGALPEASAKTLEAMRPTGAGALGGVQVIRVATGAGVPLAYSTRNVAAGAGPAATAAALEQLFIVAEGGAPRAVIVLAAEAARALQMPAAGLAAESGAPILYVTDGSVPAPTVAALGSLLHPAIYVFGATSLSAPTLSELARYGTVVRVTGTSAVPAGSSDVPAAAVENAIAVARFANGSFGWNIHEAGHGLVFANETRPLDAPAAAALSAHGDFGPLLLFEDSTALPAPLRSYLSDIEPGYTRAIQPVRGVYNHGWLIGDESAISALAQAEVDALLEIAPRSETAVEALAPPTE